MCHADTVASDECLRSLGCHVVSHVLCIYLLCDCALVLTIGSTGKVLLDKVLLGKGYVKDHTET